MMCSPGGGTLLANISSNKIIYNDKDEKLTNLVKLFYKFEPYKIIENIEKFNLNLILKNNKKQVDKEKYNCLKQKYNLLKSKNTFKANVLLLTLVIFGFNSQIRFNSKNDFNIPPGKQCLNATRKKHLINFANKIQTKHIDFMSKDFTFIYELLSQNKINKNDFFYFDPPYLISNATYNNSWNENKDQELFNLLDVLTKNNIKWAMSNVFSSKGKKNCNLIEWSKKYKTIYLNKTYKNSNYQRNDKKTKDKEVLIINYENKGI